MSYDKFKTALYVVLKMFVFVLKSLKSVECVFNQLS